MTGDREKTNEPMERQGDAGASAGALRDGGSRPASGATTLMRAAAAGTLSLVLQSLESTAANLDSVDAQGRTALMLAAGSGHATVVRALLQAGADLDPVDCDGADALAASRARCHTAVVRLLEQEHTKRSAFLGVLLGRPVVKTPAETPLAGLAGLAGLEDMLGGDQSLLDLLNASGASASGRSRESPF
ncbi:hypothetical protein T492DRAFT_1023237 [Pavlovales sp. CCMP2436]|nr:hypothetical protein T492DRAFT_1023237 [Pavlovales sp. CCMP2436]